MVGLSGVYDIAQHYAHESQRGVEHVSPMRRAMLGPAHFHHHSPSHIAAALTDHASHECVIFTCEACMLTCAQDAMAAAARHQRHDSATRLVH